MSLPASPPARTRPTSAAEKKTVRTRARRWPHPSTARTERGCLHRYLSICGTRRIRNTHEHPKGASRKSFRPPASRWVPFSHNRHVRRGGLPRGERPGRAGWRIREGAPPPDAGGIAPFPEGADSEPTEKKGPRRSFRESGAGGVMNTTPAAWVEEMKKPGERFASTGVRVAFGALPSRPWPMRSPWILPYHPETI